MKSELISILYSLVLNLFRLFGEWLLSIMAKFPKVREIMESFLLGINTQHSAE